MKWIKLFTVNDPRPHKIVKDIKAEAIKWVKFYYEHGETEQAITLETFFNISEEDLENE